MPVLSVVFVTMIINVLKVFDIVYSLAPESTQQNANVIALAMYYTAFQGGGELRRRLRDRRVPVPARHPGARPEHPPLQEGGLNGRRRRTSRRSRSRTTRRRRASLRLVAEGAGEHRADGGRRALARADDRPLHHVDPAGVCARLEGLVADLLAPEPRDLVELQRALPQRRARDGAEDDRVHRRRQHAARRDPRLDRRLRVRVARLPRPRLAVHRRDRAARRAVADGADPDVPAVRHAAPVRHVGRHRALPHRVRPAVRDLPVAQLLRRVAEETSWNRRASTARRRCASSSS